MTCSATQFFTLYFAELEKRGIPYVIIHSYEGLPEEPLTDIDYAVFDRDVPKIRPLQIELARRNGWALAQTLRHGVFAWYSVMACIDDPRENLKLDLCSSYARARRFLVPEKILLEGRRRHRGFFIPAPAAEFIYTAAKLFDAKKKSPADYIPHLRELWKQEPADAQKYFTQVFGDTGLTLAEWFDQPPEKWHRLRKIMLDRNRFGPRLLAREAVRVLQRTIHPTGAFVTLLGPDGAGKSTLLENLRTLLEPFFRGQSVFHFRPMLFQKKRESVSDPHGRPPRGLLASWLKVIYYFADWWLGFFALILPARVRSTLVIFDRSFEDLRIDPRRYRLRGADALVRVLRRLLPRADRILILDAPPELIHARKPELPVSEIESQRAALRALAAGDPRCVLLAAGEAPEKVALHAAREVLLFLAARSERRT